jgi:hypothetical protein
MDLSNEQKAFVIASVEKKIKADREAERKAKAKRK